MLGLKGARHPAERPQNAYAGFFVAMSYLGAPRPEFVREAGIELEGAEHRRLEFRWLFTAVTLVPLRVLGVGVSGFTFPSFLAA